MHRRPDPQDLLAAVAGFLREQALPQLPPHAAYNARIAANALNIVRCQLQRSPETEAAERRRLRALLQRDASLSELNRLLCQHIASGDMSFDTPGLLPHLWQTALDQLAVDQPGYDSCRRESAAALEAFKETGA